LSLPPRVEPEGKRKAGDDPDERCDEASDVRMRVKACGLTDKSRQDEREQ
jgi:hypothetical protein